jgi:hypothetical protein
LTAKTWQRALIDRHPELFVRTFRGLPFLPGFPNCSEGWRDIVTTVVDRVSASAAVRLKAHAFSGEQAIRECKATVESHSERSFCARSLMTFNTLGRKADAGTAVKMRAEQLAVSSAPARNGSRPCPKCSEFTSAFGGTADMTGLAAGSTRSRMTLSRRAPLWITSPG